MSRSIFELVDPGRDGGDLMSQEVAGARIKVVGLGGAGGNAVNNMIEAGLGGVEFIAINTDCQDLAKSRAEVRVQIGREATRGLGTGANPELGKRAAEENLDSIRQILEGADMVFLAAGMGGGTGTGAAPVVADLAKELNCLTVAVVTKPFFFEGPVRMRVAEEGLKELTNRVDTVIVIPNDKLLEMAPKDSPATGAFKQADDVLLEAVRGIADLITDTGTINVDFQDARMVMSEKGQALMGTGTASGENRALEAAKKAISNQLLEDVSIRGARGLLINITAGPDLTANEMKEAAAMIQKDAHEEAKIFFGLVIDPERSGEVAVTVIATGISKGPRTDQMDFNTLRRNAYQECIQRNDLERPTFLDRPGGAGGREEGRYTNRSTGLDMNDPEIPTFLRRVAD